MFNRFRCSCVWRGYSQSSQELAGAGGSACCTEARKEGQSLATAIVARVTYPDYPGVFQKFEMKWWRVTWVNLGGIWWMIVWLQIHVLDYPLSTGHSKILTDSLQMVPRWVVQIDLNHNWWFSGFFGYCACQISSFGKLLIHWWRTLVVKSCRLESFGHDWTSWFRWSHEPWVETRRDQHTNETFVICSCSRSSQESLRINS